MKYRIIFGIALPILLIIALAIIASYGSVEEETEFLNELSLADISNEDGIKNPIKIGTIELTNDYSLTKRHNLQQLGACLVDKDGTKQKIEAGSVEYSEGEYSYDYEPEIVRSKSSSYRSVEVGSKDEKTIHVYLRPSYQFQRGNYAELVEQYKEYDTLVIYEREKPGRYRYSYTSCYNLQEHQVDESINIKMVY